MVGMKFYNSTKQIYYFNYKITYWAIHVGYHTIGWCHILIF